MTTPIRSLIAVAVIALLAAATACRKDAGETAVQATVNARTTVVAAQPFSETVNAIGIVTGRPGHVAALSAPTAARVASVNVALGQHVGAGDVLVQLDQTPFASATRAADAALSTAEKNFERQQRLVAEGIAARKDLELASSDLEKARGDAATARRQQELSVIRSPIGGVVTRVGATLGATADPSLVLVEVADPSALDILFTVTPTQAADVQRGAKITLSAGQSANGEPLGVATTIDVGGVVDTSSRGVTIRAQAPATRRPLRIGETVFGAIIAATHPRAIVIPVEALVPDGEEFKVFVVDAAGTARARKVEVGARTDKLVEITSGLAVGERIVTYGAYGIEDSAKVVPVGAAAPKP